MHLWLGTLRQWHWISSALCLVGMLLFAATGITLNHAAQIEAQPRVTERQAELPQALQSQLLSQTPEAGLPDALRQWLESELSIDLSDRDAEWSDGELYIALPRPGGDAWLSLTLENGELLYESTDRGWISYLNDLHKGRNTGTAWSWFIDIFAAACVVFSLTGLLLLQRHASGRPTTWPLVGAGLVIPLLLALLFIH
ncbi:PepSY-associated TM helix domain-containing protein [Pseudomonas stutzeri]|uniref:PepSY-associated TM helix domain-containing protein n=1 Tax=Stutzerimonas stutzeri TaxID=316 RepID=UPI00210E3445|nr:PepSY-associated TM helix domain-containing protein [Stutzerimonas stutzeri]MCQ4288700.1 PepSY-associated TM helix domain-containing protein [Stutzerimonas stutzeri]MCQ4307921.1 PepSY-associated TM helix domain-containing protein [Stutzerimonas stutzeri]